MDNSVIIKGSKNGITVVLDNEISFDELKTKISEKFQSASKFFDNANMSITFEGRELSKEEEKEILDIITESSDINIVCVIDNDNNIDSVREDAVKRAIESVDIPKAPQCMFHKGTLRSGQMFESEGSVIILGDVNPGAKVVAKGNVIVLGSLRGNIFAGIDNNINAFVVALEMDPMQIKIGDVIARSSDSGIKIGKNKVRVYEPKIAYVYDDNIYIEDLEQNALEDLHFE